MDPIQQNPAGPPNEHTHTHTSAVTQRPPPKNRRDGHMDSSAGEGEKKGKRERCS